MSFMRQVSQALDSEHRAALDVLGRLERAFASRSRGAAPDAAFAALAAEFSRLIEHDTGRHFDFEERELFTRLTEAGEGNIAELLQYEHDVIRAVAEEILPLARAAAAGTLSASGLEELRRGTLEMVERQVSHIQKETMALLPMVEDLLDDETDRQLSLAYAES